MGRERESGSGGEWENLTLTSYSFFCTFENKGKAMVAELSRAAERTVTDVRLALSRAAKPSHSPTLSLPHSPPFLFQT